MIPISASEALKVISPRKFLGNSVMLSNRFSQLRSDSPAALGRQRSPSTKRKVSQEGSYATVTAKNLETSSDITRISTTGIDLAKVSSLCDKLTNGLGEATFDPTLQVILTDLTEAIRITNKIQNDIYITRGNLQTSSGGAQLQAQNTMVSLGAVPKRPRIIPPRDM